MPPSSTVAVTNVSASVGLTPTRIEAIDRVKTHASATPAATPPMTSTNPCRNTSRRIAPRSAPSAMRIPISCVRWLAANETTPYTPTTASVNPRSPITAARIAPTRKTKYPFGPAIDCCIVSKFEIGIFGSSARISVSTAVISVSGGTEVRSCKFR